MGQDSGAPESLERPRRALLLPLEGTRRQVCPWERVLARAPRLGPAAPRAVRRAFCCFGPGRWGFAAAATLRRPRADATFTAPTARRNTSTWRRRQGPRTAFAARPLRVLHGGTAPPPHTRLRWRWASRGELPRWGRGKARAEGTAGHRLCPPGWLCSRPGAAEQQLAGSTAWLSRAAGAGDPARHLRARGFGIPVLVGGSEV